MTIEDGVSYVALVGLSIALMLFIRRGRQRGYEALARRAQELQPEVDAVYLMVPTEYAPAYESSQLPMNTGFGGLAWYLLITGCLAYVRDGALYIEAPWWNRMQLDSIWDPPSLTMHLKAPTSNNYRAPHPVPGLVLGNQKYNRSYVVVGCNVTDPASVKRALRVKNGDPATYERYRDELLNDLDRAGFAVAA